MRGNRPLGERSSVDSRKSDPDASGANGTGDGPGATCGPEPRAAPRRSPRQGQGEEDRASRTRITESQREAIGLGLSDAFDNTLDQLQTNNLTPIAATVDELLKAHGLALQKDSMEYRVFSRLVLKGRMVALKVDAGRWSGEDGEGEPISWQSEVI